MTKITSENFQSEVMESPVPVLIDFYADWCGPCKMLTPILGELDMEYNGRAKICKVDVDVERELSDRFGVTNIPTLVFFKDGVKAGSAVGLQSKTTLEDKLSSLL